MAARRPASLLAFVAGCLLVGGALAMLLASFALPSQGLEDLGRLVGALLLAGLAGPAFALAILLAPRGSLPRWMLAVACAACALALVPGVAFVSAGVPGARGIGALFLVAAGVGLAGSVPQWRG